MTNKQTNITKYQYYIDKLGEVFTETLNTMLENDKDIDVNSIDEIWLQTDKPKHIEGKTDKFDFDENHYDEGYKDGCAETIKKFCEWINENIYKYTWMKFSPMEFGINMSDLLNDLKQAMEEQQ